MFVILHDDMRNTRDTNQAVNGNLSIFLCSPFLELMMQRFGPLFCLFVCLFVSSFFVLFFFFLRSIACQTGALSSKQNVSKQCI